MKQGVYNVDEFLTSFHNKSPIYYEIVALMKYVYIELQWPLLLGNAILNKVFFEELITEKLGMMSEKTGISLLELLMLLDNSTEHRYTIAPQGVDTYTEIEACLGSAADDFMVLWSKGLDGLLDTRMRKKGHERCPYVTSFSLDAIWRDSTYAGGRILFVCLFTICCRLWTMSISPNYI